MARGSGRRSKHENLLELARRLWREGLVQIREHAEYRKAHRSINNNDIEQVIFHGWHEKSKDVWSGEYQAWNYAIRGDDTDGRGLRVVISFEPFSPTVGDSELLLVITVINLDADD